MKVQPIILRCAMCHRKSQHYILTSVSSFGASDLDTRPPSMARGVFSGRIQECPYCGYAAPYINVRARVFKSFLKTEEYITTDGLDLPQQATKCYRSAMICCGYKNYLSAFWHFLYAAWECDDNRYKTAEAFACRLKALEAFDKILPYQQNEQVALVRIDVLRRTKQFDKALDCSYLQFANPLMQSILKYEIQRRFRILPDENQGVFLWKLLTNATFCSIICTEPSDIFIGGRKMSRYKKIEYIKIDGITSDENGNLVDREVPMVAMYDSEHVTDEKAKEMLRADKEGPYLMLVHKEHYENILRPAVKETAIRETPVRVGSRIQSQSGREYIVIGYTYRQHYANGKETTEECIEVMNSVYEHSLNRQTRRYTLEQFLQEFPDYQSESLSSYS